MKIKLSGILTPKDIKQRKIQKHYIVEDKIYTVLRDLYCNERESLKVLRFLSKTYKIKLYKITFKKLENYLDGECFPNGNIEFDNTIDISLLTLIHEFTHLYTLQKTKRFSHDFIFKKIEKKICGEIVDKIHLRLILQ